MFSCFLQLPFLLRTNLTAKATNSIAKPTNSIANGTNSIAKPTNSIANGTNSIAKATNSIANGTNSIAKSPNSIAKTCINILQYKVRMYEHTYIYKPFCFMYLTATVNSLSSTKRPPGGYCWFTIL